MTRERQETLSHEAFAGYYIDAFPHLCSVAAREVGWSSAEDVVQRAAIVCISKIKDFDNGSDVFAWMTTIVQLTAKNCRRSEDRMKRRERSVGQRLGPPALPSMDLQSLEMHAETTRMLRNAVETLEHVPKMCLLLKVVMGHSYAEISTITGVPEATARSHAHRARRILAERLADGSRDEPEASGRTRRWATDRRRRRRSQRARLPLRYGRPSSGGQPSNHSHRLWTAYRGKICCF